MIRLYHCAGSRSIRVLWALEELGLAYDLVTLPSPPRVHAKHYKQENPLGTVPLLIDGETRMTESVAICEYLSQRHGGGRLSVAPSQPGYGRYLNLTTFGEATLTFPLTLVFRYTVLEPEARRIPQVVADYSAWFLSRLNNGIDWDAVPGFLCEDRLTAADISVGFALMMASGIGLADALPGGARDYLDRLEATPSLRRCRERDRAETGNGRRR